MTIFGTSAKFGSLINWFNPIPLFIQCYISQSYEPLQPSRYCASTLVTLTQNFFARSTNNGPLRFTSLAGGLIFFSYATTAFLVKKQLIQLILYFNILISLALVYLNMECKFLGTILCIIQCLSTISPIETILKAIDKKNPCYINPVSLTLNIICSSIWSAYGFEIKQIAIIIPNLLETFITVLQIGLYLKLKYIANQTVKYEQYIVAIKSCESQFLKSIDIDKIL